MNIRSEIRRIVDEAKRAGRPITSQIIWGLIERDVPEDSFANILSSMCGRKQVVRIAGDAKGHHGGAPGFYEPGPVAVPATRSQDRISKSMGFQALARLRAARAAARAWARKAA